MSLKGVTFAYMKLYINTLPSDQSRQRETVFDLLLEHFRYCWVNKCRSIYYRSTQFLRARIVYMYHLELLTLSTVNATQLVIIFFGYRE